MAEGTRIARSRETAGIAEDWAGGAGGKMAAGGQGEGPGWALGEPPGARGGTRRSRDSAEPVGPRLGLGARAGGGGGHLRKGGLVGSGSFW